MMDVIKAAGFIVMWMAGIFFLVVVVVTPIALASKVLKFMFPDFLGP